MTMADRIVVLRGGEVEQIGTPLDLYDYPDNLFVATFIGSPSMNVLSGRIAVGDEGRQFVTDSGALLPVPARAGDLAEGRQLHYGIRPEHLVLDPDGFETTVDLCEPTGSETLVHTRLKGQDIVGIFRERVLAPRGAPLTLSVSPDHIHLYDADTGARI
jgi:multiple sugar transport system ATP-binding protein